MKDKTVLVLMLIAFFVTLILYVSILIEHRRIRSITEAHFEAFNHFLINGFEADLLK